MKYIGFGLGLCALLAATLNAVAGDKPAANALSFKVKDIDGKEVDLKEVKGKAFLIVNVASKCGLTSSQYANLTALHEKYKDKGLEILAFPANNFGSQEPGTDKEIKEFCSAKKVPFKLFSKISVKGDEMHPLYKFLTSKDTNEKFAGDITWNFEKFLVDTSGNVVGRFKPRVDPLSKEVVDAVEQALQTKSAEKK